MKHRSVLGAAAAIALSLASCQTPPQSAPANGPPSPSVQQELPSVQQELPTRLLLSGGGKKAVVHSGPSSAPRAAAQLTGRLESDGAGCITVRANDGDSSTLVFPEGTGFDGESLVLPDGSSLSDGNSVAMEGARVPANESLSMCLNYMRLFSVEKAAIVAQ